MAEVPSDGINELNWTHPFSRDPYEWEIPIVGRLMENLRLVNLVRDELDTCVWAAPMSNSVFSSKSFFSILFNDHPLPNPVPISNMGIQQLPQELRLSPGFPV